MTRDATTAGATCPMAIDPKHCAGGDHSWHWLTSERATWPSICEWINGRWFPASEISAVSQAEMARRGWRWLGQVEFPKGLLERGGPREDICDIAARELARREEIRAQVRASLEPPSLLVRLWRAIMEG